MKLCDFGLSLPAADCARLAEGSRRRRRGEEEQPPNAAFPVTEEVKRMAEAANAAREQGRKEAEKTWAAHEASWMQISPGVAAPQDLITNLRLKHGR